MHPGIPFLASFPKETVQKKEKAVYIEASATESGWQNDPAVGRSLGQMQPEVCFDTGKPAKGAGGGGKDSFRIVQTNK